MAVRIGSARIDENGKAMGGSPGDQTGKEVSTQEWYKQPSKKTWRVFRPVNPNVAEKSAWAMQAACDNPNIGYDQADRNTLYNVAKLVNFNPALVKSKVETDCSALVRVCEAYAGVMLPNFYTYTEPDILLKSGQFVEMVGSKYYDSSDYLKRGDVLVTKIQGHTVIVLTDGPKAEGFDDPDTEYVVRVASGSWHVRLEPTKNSVSLGIVSEGTDLPYLNELKDGWYKVFYNGAEAWLSSKAGGLLKKESLQYIEIKGSWYVRTKPDKESDSIGVVNTGDKIPYLGSKENGWYAVTFKEQKAWLSERSGKVVD